MNFSKKFQKTAIHQRMITDVEMNIIVNFFLEEMNI